MADVKLDWELTDAIRRNDLITVNKLIYQKADVNKNYGGGTTPLMIAAMYGRKKIAEALIKAGANVNAKDAFGVTVLMHASGYDRWEFYESSNCRIDSGLVELLLDHGADVNAKGGYKKMTAPMYAILNKRLDLVNQFINHNADLNVEDYHGHSALWYAVDSLEFLKVLLNTGASVSMQDVDGDTPLMYAANKGYLKSVKELIKAGANIDIQNRNGWTALMWAADNGHIDVVKELIKGGANLDAQSKFGRTALMRAARNGHTAVVEVLIKAGANIDIRDEDGLTAQDHAKRCKNLKIAKLIEKALQERNAKQAAVKVVAGNQTGKKKIFQIVKELINGKER